MRELIFTYCQNNNVQPSLAQLIVDFTNDVHNYITISWRQFRYKFLPSFRGLSLVDLTWKKMCEQLQKGARFNAIAPFYAYLLERCYSLGIHTEFLRQNSWLFQYVTSTLTSAIYLPEINPSNLIRIKMRNSTGHFYCNLNVECEGLRSLLKAFIAHRLTVTNSTHGIKEFISHFTVSLGSTRIGSGKPEYFDHKTFDTQLEFYKKKEVSHHVVKRNTQVLKDFYLFLLDYIKENEIEHKVFPYNCGIDRYFLLRPDFETVYSDGGRLVHYNVYDPTPSIDLWVLTANGDEEFAIGNNEITYKLFNFRGITDEGTKMLLKDFIWTYSTPSMQTRHSRLMEMLSYIKWANNEIRKQSSYSMLPMEKLKYINVFSEEFIKDYAMYLTMNYKIESVPHKWSTLKIFVNYLIKKGWKINEHIFIGVQIKKNTNVGGNPLSKEEVTLLIKDVKKKMQGGDYNTELFWIIMNLLLSTNFRIQEILKLRRNCMNNPIKDGSYPVTLQRKNNYGRYKTVPTDEYTYRSISRAIELNDFLVPIVKNRDDAKKYVFIHEGRRRDSVKIITTDWFHSRFFAIMQDIGLGDKGYTPYNLRDTYMTELMEEARKKGKSIFEVHALTDHSQINTTIKFYDKPDIRKYLEAMSGIIIGDVNIAGQIVEKVEDSITISTSDLKSITIKDECGYCNASICEYDEVHKKIDCLLCRWIIVPTDRLPFFENAVLKLDALIIKEDNYHESEHLVAQKKLYLAYILAILNFKEKH